MKLMDKEFQNKIESIFNELKFGKLVIIPIYDNDSKVGYLKPIQSSQVSDNNENIKLLAKWREANYDAFPTQFKVTIEGTKKWLDELVINKKDRILFMIYTLDDLPIGHLGFDNFDFHNRFCEIDNVVRGKENIFKGGMTLALNTLLKWAFLKLGLSFINLRVFSDNSHGISFYQRCGFKEIRKIPLECIVEGNTKKYIEIPDGANKKTDRYFSIMNLQNLYKKIIIDKPGDRLILTAGPSMSQKEIDYVLDAVKNGWNQKWNKYIVAFEKKFAEYIGVKYALATSSGTGAIHLALASFGVKKGDEVILPDLAWIAAATPVCFCGATPVFVDVEKDTGCIDPETIKNAITNKTKAIIPVHLYGHPSDIEEINKIAKDNGLYVLEDAAPSIGSMLNKKRTGSFGDIAAFSFQGAKILVTGEGGMLVTNDKKLFERAQFLGDHGRDPNITFWIVETGYKYKMSNLQAALGLAQLERIEEFVNKKRQIFKWYKKRLDDIDGFRLIEERNGIRSNYWMTSAILEKNFPVSRNELITKLREANVDSRPFFFPISKFSMFEKADNPISYYLSENGINLPSGVNLKEEEVNYVAETIRKILKI